MDKTNRTELVIGKNTEKLNKAHIALLGVGGVGGFIFEMLVLAQFVLALIFLSKDWTVE